MIVSITALVESSLVSINNSSPPSLDWHECKTWSWFQDQSPALLHNDELLIITTVDLWVQKLQLMSLSPLLPTWCSDSFSSLLPCDTLWRGLRNSSGKCSTFIELYRLSFPNPVCSCCRQHVKSTQVGFLGFKPTTFLQWGGSPKHWPLLIQSSNCNFLWLNNQKKVLVHKRRIFFFAQVVSKPLNYFSFASTCLLTFSLEFLS